MAPEDLQLLLANLDESNDSDAVFPGQPTSSHPTRSSVQAFPVVPTSSNPPSTFPTSSVTVPQHFSAQTSPLPPLVPGGAVSHQDQTSPPTQNPFSATLPPTIQGQSGQVKTVVASSQPSRPLSGRRASLTVQTIDGGTSLSTPGSQSLLRQDPKAQKSAKVNISCCLAFSKKTFN